MGDLGEDLHRSSLGISFAVTDENPSFVFSDDPADWPAFPPGMRRRSFGGVLSHPVDAPSLSAEAALDRTEAHSRESRDGDLALPSGLRRRPSPPRRPPGPPDYPAWLAAPEDDTVLSPRSPSDPGAREEFPPPYPSRCPKSNACAGCLAALDWPLLAFGKAAHHCRLCGNAFCGACSSYWTLLPHMGCYEKQRTCKACHMRATGNQRPQPEEPQPLCRSSSPALLSWLPAALLPFLRRSPPAGPHPRGGGRTP
eukprot:EG_transcript_19681